MGPERLPKRAMWTTYIAGCSSWPRPPAELLGTLPRAHLPTSRRRQACSPTRVSRCLSIRSERRIRYRISTLGLATSFDGRPSNVLGGLSRPSRAVLTSPGSHGRGRQVEARSSTFAATSGGNVNAPIDRGRRQHRVRVDQARRRDRERDRVHLHGHLDAPSRCRSDLCDARSARGGDSVIRELSTTFLAGVREVRGHHVLGPIPMVALLYGMASGGWDRLSSAPSVDRHRPGSRGWRPDLPHPRRVRSGRTRDGPHDAHVRETSGAARRPRPRRQGARRDRHRDVRVGDRVRVEWSGVVRVAHELVRRGPSQRPRAHLHHVDQPGVARGDPSDGQLVRDAAPRGRRSGGWACARIGRESLGPAGSRPLGRHQAAGTVALPTRDHAWKGRRFALVEEALALGDDEIDIPDPLDEPDAP